MAIGGSNYRARATSFGYGQDRNVSASIERNNEFSGERGKIQLYGIDIPGRVNVTGETVLSAMENTSYEYDIEKRDRKRNRIFQSLCNAFKDAAMNNEEQYNGCKYCCEVFFWRV